MLVDIRVQCYFTTQDFWIIYAKQDFYEIKEGSLSPPFYNEQLHSRCLPVEENLQVASAFILSFDLYECTNLHVYGDL